MSSQVTPAADRTIKRERAVEVIAEFMIKFNCVPIQNMVFAAFDPTPAACIGPAYARSPAWQAVIHLHALYTKSGDLDSGLLDPESNVARDNFEVWRKHVSQWTDSITDKEVGDALKARVVSDDPGIRQGHPNRAAPSR